MNNLIIKNKKAYFDYEILETYETGIVLFGSEVKAIRKKHISIKEAYCKIDKNNEIFLINSTISLESNIQEFRKPDEKREKKLLMKKKEIKKLNKKVQEEQITIVPLEVYFNKNNKCKILIGLAKGKKLYDKREALKEKDIQMETKKLIKEYF